MWLWSRKIKKKEDNVSFDWEIPHGKKLTGAMELNSGLLTERQKRGVRGEPMKNGPWFTRNASGDWLRKKKGGA